MSVVKINAVDVPADRGREFEARFASRAGAVEHSEGFEAFELLRPAGGATRYFVYTCGASEEAYQAWLNSQDFAKAHAHVAAEQSGAAAPVAHGAELLSFEVIERRGQYRARDRRPARCAEVVAGNHFRTTRRLDNEKYGVLGLDEAGARSVVHRVRPHAR